MYLVAPRANQSLATNFKCTLAHVKESFETFEVSHRIMASDGIWLLSVKRDMV